MTTPTTDHLRRERAPGRARDLLVRVPPPNGSPAASDVEAQWHTSASTRRRSIPRPHEAGHSIAWLIWVVGSILTVLQLDNPLYLALLWGVATLVWSACAGDGPLASAFGLLLKLGGFIFAMHVFFSVITAGFLRGETVLLTLPTWTLPRLLGGIQLGGVVSLEQLVSGASRGFRLWTLLLLVGAFNGSVNHYRLLRRTPRFLFHAGLIITIGLAFVPQTLIRLRSIREAQRLRGHRFHSWRDALPLFVPLLSGGLERALGLAEAMEARGYGRMLHHDTPSARTARRTQWLTLVGLILLMLGIAAYLFYPAGSLGSTLGLAGLIGGAGLIGTAWWAASRIIVRTAYIRERWTAGAALTTALAIGAPLGLWLLSRAGVALGYRIFPQVGLPPFAPLVAVPLLFLAAPALLLARRR